MEYSEGDWEEGDCSSEKMLDMNKALQMLDEWIRDEPIDCLQEEADASLPAVNVGAQAHVRSSTSLLLVQDGSGSITSDMECTSSCSSSSSSSSSSSGGAAPSNHQATTGKTGAKRTAFPDLKKIIVKKQIMDKAVERLGGGRKGALMLWRLVQVWLKHQEGTVDHANLLPKPSELGLGLPDAHQLANLSSIALQPAAAGGQGHYGYSQLQFSNGPNVLPGMAADTIVSNASSYYQGQMGSPRPMLPVHHSSSINRNHFQASQVMHERNVRVAAAAVQDKKSQDAPISAEARTWNSAATRAARKSRMQQQRKSLAHQRSRACMTSSLNWSSTSSTSFPGGNVCVPSLDQHGARVRNSEKKNLRLLMQKDLRPSDVGNLGRIVLPKKEAELHLPFLSLREGITLSMEDMSTSQLWHFKYRFWPNNKSRMYLLENTGEFVKFHGLQEGDSILLYRDHKAGKYVIYGKKNAKLPPDAVSLEQGSGVKGGCTSVVSECQTEALTTNPGMYTDGLSELERFPSFELGDLTIDQMLGVEAPADLKETSKTSSNENG